MLRIHTFFSRDPDLPYIYEIRKTNVSPEKSRQKEILHFIFIVVRKGGWSHRENLNNKFLCEINALQFDIHTVELRIYTFWIDIKSSAVHKSIF